MGGRSSAQLDDLARAVADGVPRRVVVGRIAAFMAAFVVGDPELALGAKRRCPKGRRRCGDICCRPGYVCHTHKGKKHCVCPKPHKVCNGRCVNTKADERNCGRCGHRCASGETCVAGTCTAPPEQTQPAQPTPEPVAATCTDGVQNGNETDVDCGGPSCPQCVEGKHCATASDCATGVCSGGVCVAPAPACSADVCGAQHGCPACANGKTCSSGSDCASGHCSGGVCVQCATAGDCTSTTASACHTVACVSGTCGQVVDDSNVPASPNQCTYASCSGGTPVSSYVAYGTPTGGSTCSGSTLSTPICDGNGGTTQTQTSCGGYVCQDATSCYSSCSSPAQCDATHTCLNGQCVMRQCTNDSQCPVANGTGACSNGLCVVATCSPGYANCDGQYSTGCETNTYGDVQNCGACGHPCPSVTNANAVCVSGTCGFVCKPGFLDCNGNPADGCEYSGTTCP